MSRGRPVWLVAVMGLAMLSACAPAYLHSRVAQHATLSAHARIAVLPVTTAISARGAEPSQGYQIAPGAEAIVTRKLYEALARQTSFDIMGQPMVEQALAASTASPSTPVALQALAGKLGAEAVLRGTVTLFRERDGSHVSISRPAGVGLELSLISGRDGRLLWSGRYYEVQKSFSEDPRTISLYWKRGTRWLTAEELATYAVMELVKTLPPVQAENDK